MSVSSAQWTFWLFAAVMGLSLSTIFLVFTGQSITQVFFVTAAGTDRSAPVRLTRLQTTHGSGELACGD
jgi:hypothetical protein